LHVEAFPWDGAPHDLIGDRDLIYGRVTRGLRENAIRDKPTAPSTAVAILANYAWDSTLQKLR
jgi:hypothetical protein